MAKDKTVIKVSEDDKFNNCFVRGSIQEAMNDLEYLFETGEYNPDDEHVLCFKIETMTEDEFNNLPEFTGF